jgi:branched-chain amino acid aminotransferase
MSYAIEITERETKTAHDTRSLPFGKTPTDHMFIAAYRDGNWQQATIQPFQELTLSPFALCLHYGQTVFEGMKAFKMHDGSSNIFRIEKHYQRFLKSLARMCMPAVPFDLFKAGMCELVKLDRNWVPADSDGSLYLRPFMIADEARMGVKIADEYLFMVVATPAYQYYAEPLHVKVETNFARAAEGGTGFAKCGGNYGAAFYPTQLAREEGFDQVIWTDAHTHQYIEESGTMNLMFVIDGQLHTPALSGTILDGVTRDSLLTIAKERGITIVEGPLRVTDITDALNAGKRVEAFGAGTAAVVAPIASINVAGQSYNCYIGDDAVMHTLKNDLYNIRTGNAADTHGWNTIV